MPAILQAIRAHRIAQTAPALPKACLPMRRRLPSPHDMAALLAIVRTHCRRCPAIHTRAVVRTDAAEPIHAILTRRLIIINSTRIIDAARAAA